MVILDYQFFCMHLQTIKQQQFSDFLLKLLKNMACLLVFAVIKAVKIMKLGGLC